MHTGLKFIYLAAFCSVLLVSCKKFDNEGEGKPNKNKITFLGKEYKLTGAVAINFGKDDDTTSGFNYQGYNLDLFLFTEGITNVNAFSQATGSGQLLNMDLYASADTLTEGAFTVNQSLKVGTTDETYLIPVLNGKYDYNAAPEFNQGDFTVKQSGTTYTIEGILENSSGEKLEFFYQGEVTFRRK